MKTINVQPSSPMDAGNQPPAYKTRSDKISTAITNTFGSVTFLFVCTCFIVAWICCNLNLIPRVRPFDPFPFPELEMVVSVFAIILSITVLISQKRQAKLERISQQVEFEINIRAEQEITKMLEMLHDIQKRLGIENTDEELEQMKEMTDIDELHRIAQEE